MKGSDLYCLAIRLAGILFIVWALFDSGHVVLAALHLYLGPSNYPPSSLLAATTYWVILGVLLTVASRPLTRLVYGSDSNRPTTRAVTCLLPVGSYMFRAP